MCDNSPIGCEFDNLEYESYSLKMGVLSKDGTNRKIRKIGSDNISSYSVCYLLYLIAEKENRYSFTVSELYENKELMGPLVVF